MSFVQNSGNHDDPSQDDRRRAVRKRTFREVLFSGPDARQLLREGTLVDFSVRGAQIHTHQPEPEGTRLDIELYRESAAPQSRPQLFQGRVMWVESLPSGDFAMGVHFHLPSAKARSEPGGAEETFDIEGGAEVRFKPSVQREPGRRPRRTPFYLLVALIVVVLAVLLYFFLSRDATASLYGKGLGGAYRPEPAPAAPISGAHAGLAQLSQPQRAYASPGHLLAAAGECAAMGQLETAKGYYQRVLRHAATNPSERLQASMGLARMLGLSGEREEADSMLTEAIGQTEDTPAEWLEAARDLQTELHNTSAALTGEPPMVDALAIEPSDSAAQGKGLEIRVQRSGYVMAVVRDGQVLRSYPIGLGRDESTPPGSFRVANKITEPDWYNRGETVEAGDPQNPLGKRWMGLGKNGTATSYGIHPTADADSVGQAKSRGCIRMRPEDAEAVFRLCPVGTPVVIED